MRLAVFDIDGTLTHLSPESDACFMEAVKSVTGPVDLDESWREYTHVSDSGILEGVLARHLGRPPTADEDRAIQERYRAALERDRVRIRPLPGALEFLERLNWHAEWRTAIAAGNWTYAATWKMESAGAVRDSMPMEAASDHVERASILRIAIQRAGGSFGRVVYLGDGEWDRDAAKKRPAWPSLPWAASPRPAGWTASATRSGRSA